MGKNPPKWLPGDRVNETILLQRKSVEQLRADRILRRDKHAEMKQKRKNKIDAKRKRKLSTKKFISAQSILKYAQREKHQARKFHKIGEKAINREKLLGPERMAKQYKASGIALIVRSKGNLVPKAVEESFRKLGLSKLYSARLIPVSESTSVLLKQLRPFSFLGFPSPAQVERLVRTRACLWNEETQSKKYLSGNRLIEEAFGQYNILCVEDLTASIVNKVDNIDDILKLLAPFDFHPPHQLFMERHRTAHQKLEIVNPESFAAYIQEQIGDTMKATAKENKKKAKDSDMHQKKIAIANAKMAMAKKENVEKVEKEKEVEDSGVSSPDRKGKKVASAAVAEDTVEEKENGISIDIPIETKKAASPSKKQTNSTVASPAKRTPKTPTAKKAPTPKKPSPKMATPKKIAAKKETPKKVTPRKVVAKRT
eukprot:Tbor_TRINITY_DN4446_c0_g1::TRINITY_DN4446_c0_g1_i1::g.7870::m.7870